MGENSYNDDIGRYSKSGLENDLQRLEAEHYLYEMFDDFLSDYDTGEVDNDEKMVYLEKNETSDILDEFVEEYGDQFLDINPELTDEDREFYENQPDELYDELVSELVRGHISEGAYFEAEFSDSNEELSADTDGFQYSDEVHSALQGAAKMVTVGALIIGGMTGAAAAPDNGPGIHSDTDSDGLPDIYEEEVLEGADPEQKDVFVEVDYSSNCGIDEDFFEELEEMYANAPVENPDGTQGINLHVMVDDELEMNDTVNFREQNGSMNDRPEITSQHFDTEGHGTHYMLLVDDAYNGKTDVLGTAVPGSMVVECGDRPDAEVLHTSSHELGHSLGLSSKDFKGVDSEKISFDKYPSAMNYNNPEEGNVALNYSNGTNSDQDFNDWKHIESGQKTPQVDSELIPEE